MSTETFTEVGNPKPSILKDPSAVLDYSFDWSAWLAEGESIVTYDVTVDGVTKNSQARAGAIVTAWIAGGTLGEVASVTCAVTTDSVPARTEQRTVYLRIQER